MYVIILTLSARFLATCRALAAELPQMRISTDQVQELEFLPHVTEEEVRHFAESYIASNNYDKVEIIRR